MSPKETTRDFLMLHPAKFYVMFRMKQASFDDLLAIFEAFVSRSPRSPRRKPVIFRYRFTLLLNLLAHGFLSLEKVAFVSGVDAVSLGYSWIPDACGVNSSLYLLTVARNGLTLMRGTRI